MVRSPEEVFEDHLRLARVGAVEEDLARNFADDVVVLTRAGVYRGHDGVRELAATMQHELPDARFTYGTRVVADEIALLEWTADAQGAWVRDGVDTFIVRGGQIVAQTTRYTVERGEDGELRHPHFDHAESYADLENMDAGMPPPRTAPRDGAADGA
jgi:hypothetical protein